jgi:hypothetical protein
MRISRHVREQAALLCSAAASNSLMGLDAIAEHIGGSRTAVRLAALACNHVYQHDLGYRQWSGVRPIRERDAEAESLIRSGWSP